MTFWHARVITKGKQLSKYRRLAKHLEQNGRSKTEVSQTLWKNFTKKAMRLTQCHAAINQNIILSFILNTKKKAKTGQNAVKWAQKGIKRIYLAFSAASYHNEFQHRFHEIFFKNPLIPLPSLISLSHKARGKFRDTQTSGGSYSFCVIVCACVCASVYQSLCSTFFHLKPFFLVPNTVAANDPFLLCFITFAQFHTKLRER